VKDLKSIGSREAAAARWMRLRVKLLGGALLCFLGVVLARAVQLQVFEREALVEMARDQYVRDVEIPARRGDISDRRGVPLAQSVEVDSIWADPALLPDVPRAARELGRRVHVDPRELLDRLSRGRRFAWVKRRASPDEVGAVKALKLRGIGFAREPRRFYPQRELAAHVLGMVGTEARGLEGLELAFEDELSGQSSRLGGLRDARGRKLLMQGSGDAVERQGAAVTLTLDRHLQYVAEKALAKAVSEARGVGGMAVVLDPRTGELLALANHPTFNPNAPGDVPGEVLRNRAALDTFEPGSTFKAFVVAAALEHNAIRPDEIFYCENGAWPLGSHVINDTHPYEWLTPRRILQVSSNICAAKIAQKLGREKLARTYADFGFGQRSGLALPGEGRGVVPFPRGEIVLATQAFGQGLTATAVQIAAAFGALANDGVLMRPYLVARVVDPDGVVLLENQPTPVRRVVSARTARQVIAMLESVVEKEGTAPRAYLEEYRVAGKTGTAQKADPVARGYSDKRIASFIGVVPAEAPRAVIAVVVDEPKTDIYGGVVAAPAFKEIARAALPYLGVVPSRRAVTSATGAISPTPAAASNPAPAPAAIPALTDAVARGDVRVPDLAGRPGREAIASLLAASLNPRVEGTGRVISQVPTPGMWVSKGARITVQMAPRQ
jgi:cell division protein FtsI (penicillin-binding protein 3)